MTNVLVAAFIYLTFGWINKNFAITQIETTWWSFSILLILFDFLFYWFHRYGHSINILWAAHMPHHTSEEFNLFVGVRASITQRLFSFSFMWPLAIIGFSARDIYTASAVQLILAFWHHTKIIGKMPGFEIIFNSPSYHRVHHAINDKYLDKNFGEIFIIWDKMFGTCAEEDEPVIYGALTPIKSWNPNKIYIHYFWILMQDALKTKSWWDKFRLWFMPLGWRPKDVQHIDRGIINENTIEKFKSPMFRNLKPYIIIHLLFGLWTMFLVITPSIGFSNLERLTLAAFVWAMITSWGGLLEAKNWARIFEPIQIGALCTYLIYLFNNHQKFLFTQNFIMAFALISIAWVLFLLKQPMITSVQES